MADGVPLDPGGLSEWPDPLFGDFSWLDFALAPLPSGPWAGPVGDRVVTAAPVPSAIPTEADDLGFAAGAGLPELVYDSQANGGRGGLITLAEAWRSDPAQLRADLLSAGYPDPIFAMPGGQGFMATPFGQTRDVATEISTQERAITELSAAYTGWGIDPISGQIITPQGTPATPQQQKSVWETIISRLPDVGLALALGGAGALTSFLAAPDIPDVTLPGVQPNPVVAAGQQTALQTLAAQDPVSAIRMQTLAGLISPEQAAAALATLGVTDPGALVASWGTGGGLTGQQALSAAVGSAISGQAEIAEALRQQAEWARTGAASLYPGQTAIRESALSQIPLYMGPEPTDPVDQAIQARVLSALQGQVADPATEREIAKQREILLRNLNRMYPRVSTGGTPGGSGAEFEGTVAGTLAQEFESNAAITRAEINRRILETLAPQEQTRRAFTAGRGDTRLGQSLALSGLGLPQAGTTATSLANVLPVGPLLGLNDASERTANANLEAQVALANIGAAQRAAEQQSTAINRIFGTAAETLTRPSLFAVPTNLLTGAA